MAANSPFMPLPMRSPMAPRPSPMNHRYGGGLADRGPMQTGRSAYDLNRIGEQRFRQTGDPSMMMSLDFRNQMQERMQRPTPPAMPMELPQAPTPMSMGQMVPGRSQVSMVWQPAMQMPTPPATAAAPVPMGATPSFMPPETPLSAPPLPRMPFEGMTQKPTVMKPIGFFPQSPTRMLPYNESATPQGLGFNTDLTQYMPYVGYGPELDTTKPLPPSSLGGALGIPPPPAVDVQRLPGTNYGLPVIHGEVKNQTLPLLSQMPQPPPLSTKERQTAAAANMVPTGEWDAQGLPVLKPGKAPSAPRIQTVMEGDTKVNVQWNADKNRWERVQLFNPGDPDGNGMPGDQRGKPMPTAANGKTVSPFVAAFGNF